MSVFLGQSDSRVVELLLAGKVGILRTDTLYGVVARADELAAVQSVFAVKGRDDNKSPIVLIGEVEQMFNQPSAVERRLLDDVWPGKVSVILDADEHAPEWLTRGNGSIAYRLPADRALRELLQKTGPLIAPSANPQGLAPARTVKEAEKYFGDTVDFYVDGGEVTDLAPSQLLRIDASGEVERLR